MKTPIRIVAALVSVFLAGNLLHETSWHRNLSSVEPTFGGIHLGKCGGVSMIQTMQHANQDTELGLWRHVDHFFHMARPEYKKYDKWIILIRDPIDRFKSLWVYDHPKNLPYRSDHFERTENKGLPDFQHELIDCFGTLDNYARNGLDLVEYENGTFCQGMAKRSLMGDEGQFMGSDHLRSNFNFYFSVLLREKPRDEIYIVRQENMLDDLNGIDRMLDGPGKLQGLMHFQHFSTKDLPYSNRTLSDLGRQRLCRSLCQEIQIYKELMRRAVNIDDLDRALQSIREECPVETALDNSERCEWTPYKWVELLDAPMSGPGSYGMKHMDDHIIV